VISNKLLMNESQQRVVIMSNNNQHIPVLLVNPSVLQ